MRRALLVVAVGLAALTAVAVTVTWRTGQVPLGGCRITSVDQDEYVAGNRAILDTLPRFPEAKRIGSSSWGSSVGDSCLPRENSGPYVSYVTSEVFTLPPSGRPLVPVPWYEVDEFGNRVPGQAPVVLAYLDGKLRENGWRGGGTGGCCSNFYEKGTATLNVNVFYDGAGQYEFRVVHDKSRR